LKVGIIGSRNFDDYDLLEESILEIVKLEDIDAIISGGARGADTLAEKFAVKHNKIKVIFKPNWIRYRSQAGFLRNTDIVETSDILIAFWDGKSSGTKDSISKAEKRNIPLYIIKTSKS
jgi:hypothetical protein